ncbi:hypothetical protein GYMLUDRAFT_247705 [Collybiopsis luxurians FD-317 M1]|uniref:NB-ARC domain-containing protein n=1 Tax=Collybiopsis luxurians FD-317 M1 TaxID=944289 RepID=A0A0D0CF33_9AGAR|nr:hypothetical protein GYMLUDRAFT_247705 [Collybiopsis luxurians FD-317 M1]
MPTNKGFHWRRFLRPGSARASKESVHSGTEAALPTTSSTSSEMHQPPKRSVEPLGPASILSGASNFGIHGSPTFNAAGRDLHVQVNQYHNKDEIDALRHDLGKLMEGRKPDLHLLPSQVLICPSPSPYFVGRQDILDQLSGIFAIPAANVGLQQKVVPLVASGGTGKTQVVLKFVAENQSRFSNIWFFNATSDVTLTANLKELGKALGIGEETEEVKKYLARNQENWLCIFDNADDDQLYIKDYIPSCNHGNIIITSRLKDTAQMASPGVDINFGDLAKDDAIWL